MDAGAGGGGGAYSLPRSLTLLSAEMESLRSSPGASVNDGALSFRRGLFTLKSHRPEERWTFKWPRPQKEAQFCRCAILSDFASHARSQTYSLEGSRAGVTLRLHTDPLRRLAGAGLIDTSLKTENREPLKVALMKTVALTREKTAPAGLDGSILPPRV